MSDHPWVRWYVGDYLADTRRLSRDEHGAYILLLMDYYSIGPPPDDDHVLARITLSASLSEWRALRPAVRSFFQIHDGHWHHKRCDAEIERREKDIKARRLGAYKTNLNRGGNGSAERDAERDAKHANQIQNQIHTQKPDPKPPPEGKAQRNFESEGGAGGDSADRANGARRRTRTKIPDEDSFQLTPERRAYLQEQAPRADATKVWVLFRDHHLAHGSVMADWPAAWRTWCQRQPQYSANGKGNGSVRHKTFREIDAENEARARQATAARLRARHPDINFDGLDDNNNGRTIDSEVVRDE